MAPKTVLFYKKPRRFSLDNTVGHVIIMSFVVVHNRQTIEALKTRQFSFVATRNMFSFLREENLCHVLRKSFGESSLCALSSRYISRYFSTVYLQF